MSLKRDQDAEDLGVKALVVKGRDGVGGIVSVGAMKEESDRLT